MTEATNTGAARPLPIRRAAVLGAGIMGRGIAAHLAGCGIEVRLLDIVPPGETSDDPAKRNAWAAGGLTAALKSKPALFYNKKDARLITVGNMTDDLDALADCDWIVEAVKEDLDIKRSLFERLDAVRKPGALISSNTSGLPLAKLVEGRSDDFRQNFIITHFFNPVRYMKLLEVVDGPDTNPELVPGFVAFARSRLGKGVVFAKDSPAFVANRIGTFSIMYTIHKMLEQERSPEFVDSVFGPAMGRPKSAVFRTGDVVGLDTLASVITHLHEDLPNDEMRDTFTIPDFMQHLLDNKLLGSKTKAGFYKKEGKEIVTFDPYAKAYRGKVKEKFPSLGAARNIEDAAERVKKVVWSDDDAGKFAWLCTAHTVVYAARRLGEVAEDIVQIDNAMKWGFGQALGPFETWDAIGVPESVARMKEEGIDVPGWVEEMLARGQTSFYEGNLGGRSYWNAKASEKKPEPISPRFMRLPATIKDPSLVAKNPGARLWDVGDGVFCVEFRTKMNAVDADLVGMINQGIEHAEANGQGLILGNHAENAFSAGANLMLIAMAANQKAWDQIEDVLDGFQAVNLRLRHSQIPTVAAPFGLTLGGGAEMTMGADAIQAHAELYIGLVEVGVGLIPGGGGTFQLLHNVSVGAPDDSDPLMYLRKAFMTIAMASVKTSAEEAREAGFLQAHDRVTMDRDELLTAAKQRAIGMAQSDYRPSAPRAVRVGGKSGYGTLYSALWGMKGANQISEHDMKIGAHLARIMSGGDVKPGTMVSEARFHELEKEAFLSLCGEQLTIDRIQHMLMTNKPLRN